MTTLPAENLPGAALEAHMVKVVNRNPFPVKDMFDGVPITFAPNVAQNIPLEMAAHFFGYPGELEYMRAHTCKRHGWNTPAHIIPGEDGRSLADKYFGNFIIKPVVFELIEKDPDGGPERPIPANAGADDDEIERSPTPQGAPIDQAFGTRTGQGRRGRRKPRRVE